MCDFRRIWCCGLAFAANTHLSLSLYMQVYLPTGIFHEGLFYFCLNGRLRLAIFCLRLFVCVEAWDDTNHKQTFKTKKHPQYRGRMLFGICGCDVLKGDKKTLCKEVRHHYIKWALVITNMSIITSVTTLNVITIVFGRNYILVRTTPQMKSKIPIILWTVTLFLTTPNRPSCSTNADPTITPTSERPIVSPAPRAGIKIVIIST